MSDNVKGYNKYFIATESIASQNRHQYGDYDWATDTQGNIIGTRLIQDASITNAKIINLDADKILAGTLTVAVNLGTASTGYLLLDGANNRILVNDGTTNRIVIGNV